MEITFHIEYLEVITMENGVVIKSNTLQKKLMYDSQKVLEYTIHYPQLYVHNEPLQKINAMFQAQAQKLVDYSEQELFQHAVADYKQRKEDNIPFFPYVVMLDYYIPYNRKGLLSILLQKYVYAGGAHGNTNQYAYNFYVPTQKEVQLAQLYPNNSNYQTQIKNEVKRQIKEQMATNKGMYFDDYEKLVDQYFDPYNFYLMENGIGVFFNLYEIAPYVQGIPSFFLPYNKSGPIPLVS